MKTTTPRRVMMMIYEHTIIVDISNFVRNTKRFKKLYKRKHISQYHNTHKARSLEFIIVIPHNMNPMDSIKLGHLETH